MISSISQLKLPLMILIQLPKYMENEFDRICFYLTCKYLYQTKKKIPVQIKQSWSGFKEESRKPIKRSNLFFHPKILLDCRELENPDEINQIVPFFTRNGYNPEFKEINQLRIMIENEEGKRGFSYLVISNPLLHLEKLEVLLGLTEPFKIPSGTFKNHSIKELEILVKYSEKNIRLEDILEIGSIPKTVEKLTIDHRLVRHSPLKLIPPSVTDLTLREWHSLEGEVNMVPPTVVKLHIYSYLTSKDTLSTVYLGPGCFPSQSLTDLKMSCIDGFISPNAIPNTVKRLQFSLYHPLMPRVIPNSVEELIFDRPFNQDVYPDLIPNGVKEVTVHQWFTNSFLPGSIPPSVSRFNYKSKNGTSLLLNGILPCQGLTHLEISNEIWNCQTQLPSTLTYLDCIFDTIPKGLLPLNLKKLVLSEGVLPSTLETLKILNGISSSVSFPWIPKSVKNIYLSGDYQEDIPVIPVGALPDSIDTIEFGKFIQKQQFSHGVLPLNLKILDFHKCVPDTPFDTDDCKIPNSVQFFYLQKEIQKYETFSK
eukprot:gene7648-9406_t